MLGPAVQLGRDVPAAAADRERDLELALLREVGDLELRVEILEVGRRLDVTGGDDPRALLRDVHLDLGRLAVQPADEVAEVEDDVRDVLADARERRELVRGARPPADVTAAPSKATRTRGAASCRTCSRARSSGSITNTPRFSSTSSWTIFRSWNSMRLVLTAMSPFR